MNFRTSSAVFRELYEVKPLRNQGLLSGPREVELETALELWNETWSRAAPPSAPTPQLQVTVCLLARDLFGVSVSGLS